MKISSWYVPLKSASYGKSLNLRSLQLPLSEKGVMLSTLRGLDEKNIQQAYNAWHVQTWITQGIVVGKSNIVSLTFSFLCTFILQKRLSFTGIGRHWLDISKFL